MKIWVELDYLGYMMLWSKVLCTLVTHFMDQAFLFYSRINLFKPSYKIFEVFAVHNFMTIKQNIYYFCINRGKIVTHGCLLGLKLSDFPMTFDCYCIFISYICVCACASQPFTEVQLLFLVYCCACASYLCPNILQGISRETIMLTRSITFLSLLERTR